MNTATQTQVSFQELDKWLGRIPVLADVHPLVPLCLQAGTQITKDTNRVLNELDCHTAHQTDPLLLLSKEPALLTKFPYLSVLDHPPVDVLNVNMCHHLDYARQFLLTTHKVASYIENDVAQHPTDVVILFLVDGLSYGDTLTWEANIQPCFVDGPSVTYRFDELNKSMLIEAVGFASIINSPSVYKRLYKFGFHHARGYTYWTADNAIAEYMFCGIPSERVVNFESILRLVKEEGNQCPLYIQIVREGLDGLAHGKRELRRPEIDAAIDVILRDVERLLDVFGQKSLRTRVYLTADHGILWKNEHTFQNIPNIKDSHSRFTSNKPPDHAAHLTVKLENVNTYYLFKYPYTGHPIPANDSGVHGGLSYQESIVPFAIFEV